MRHVLIVDDALDLGRLLKTALSMIDSTMPIVVVPSAEEALLEGTRYPLDLLVTDIRLPGISGVELIQKIRKHHPDVKIIVITGMSDDSLMKEIRNLGVDALFNKPLSIPEFTEIAKRCLLYPSEAVSTNTITESQPSKAAKAIPHQIADILTGLRQRLGAIAVVLLDERSRITAQAGELPGAFRGAEVFPKIQPLGNSNASMSTLLGKSKPVSVTAYCGEKYDLVLAPLISYTLFTLLETSTSNLRLALCFEETLIALKDLTISLEGMGLLPAYPMNAKISITTAEEGEEPEPAAQEDELALQKFEALFTAPNDGVVADDVDAFWEDLTALEGGVAPENPDVISYEQARQLGLAPKDEPDK